MRYIFVFQAVFLLLNLQASAQTNYQPGLVVTAAGDTLKGFINYREWENNPGTVSFKTKTDHSAVQEFTPRTSKYFEVAGVEAFIAYRVSISLDRIDLNNRNNSFSIDTSKTSAQVFLKVLHKGKNVALFAYTDPIKTRYYILEKGNNQPQELIYRRYYDQNYEKNNTIMVKKTYAGQLWLTATNLNLATPKLRKQLESVKYHETDLMEVASWLNELNKQDVKQLRNTKSRFRGFAGIGFTKGNAYYKGDTDLTHNQINKAAYFPKVAIGGDLFINPNIQKLFFRAEVAFTGGSYTISAHEMFPTARREYIQNFSQKTVSLVPQFIFNIYNKEKFKFFVGAGAGINYARYSDIRYKEITTQPDGSTSREDIENNNQKFNNFYSVWVAKAGVVVSKKMEVSYTHLGPANITSYVTYSAYLVGSQFQINYLFNN